MSALTVLVTGATGCVGRAVVAAAQRRGWDVRGLARTPPGPPWPTDVAITLGDVRDHAAVARAAAGCDAVVHLAGWVHAVPRDDRDRNDLRTSIVDGTDVVASVAASVAARLVLVSTVAVFGPSAYGRAKLEAEARARARCPDAIVLRSAVVFGPHDRGNLASLIGAVERRLGFVIGDGRNRKSIVYVANLADRIVECVARRDLAGTWNAADDPAPTQAALLGEIARALGRRRPVAIPRGPASAAAAALDLLVRPRWRDRVRTLSQTTEFPGFALDSVLGYAPRVAWTEAIRTTIAWRQAHRWTSA